MILADSGGTATMAKIEKLAVSFNGLMAPFVKLVEAWRPPVLKGETAYRDHLVDHIRAAVPEDARVEREYRHRGTTMDIYVSWKGILQDDDLAFELKKDLVKKTDFDRLVGQIEGLDPVKNKTIVVLVGKTDRALLGRLREKYAKVLQAGMEPAKMAIVCTEAGRDAE
jgi:hypothetical protein